MPQLRVAKSGDSVYFQQCSHARVTEEIHLVKAATVRESLLEQLSNLIRDVNLQQRLHDDSCILETFVLLNQIRNATFQLCDAIEKWQAALTKNTNPQLFGSDYIGCMSKTQDFLINVKVKRLYHFNIGSGNILILPLLSNVSNDLKTTKENPLSPELLEQMKLFAKPSEQKVLQFYQMLKKYLSKKAFKQILPLDQWLQNSWTVPSPLLKNPLATLKSKSNASSVVSISPSQGYLELKDKVPSLVEEVSAMPIQKEPISVGLSGIMSLSKSRNSKDIVKGLPVLTESTLPPDDMSISTTSSFNVASLDNNVPFPLISRTDSSSSAMPETQLQKEKGRLASMKKAKSQFQTDNEYIEQMQKKFLSKKTSNLISNKP
jgi:hypothetical protein